MSKIACPGSKKDFTHENTIRIFSLYYVVLLIKIEYNKLENAQSHFLRFQQFIYSIQWSQKLRMLDCCSSVEAIGFCPSTAKCMLFFTSMVTSVNKYTKY